VIQLRMNNVTTQGRFDWSSFIRVPPDPTALARYQLQGGDVLFNNTNSTELVGKTALFTRFDEPVVFSNHFTRLRTATDHLLPDFLAFWLQAQWQQRVFAAICNRWIGQSAVQRDKLLDLVLPLPPLIEQKRIATILARKIGAVEQVQAAATAQLMAAKELPAAYLRTIFDSLEARSWPKRPLKEVSHIGAGITLGRDVRDAETCRVPYLRVANVKDGHLDLSDVYEIEATHQEITRCQLRFGDLLLTEGGDPDKLGRGTFWGDQLPQCLHQNHIFRVRFDLTAFSPAFLAAQVGSSYGKAYFLAHAKQTTGIATINQKVLGDFPLMTPPLAEQHRLVTLLGKQMEAVDQARQALTDQLTALNQLPATLLRHAFSGGL